MYPGCTTCWACIMDFNQSPIKTSYKYTRPFVDPILYYKCKAE